MKDHCEILIIIPIYNESECIIRCLESVSKQDFSKFKVYIHDNASTDNTYSKVKSVSLIDPRFITRKIDVHLSAWENWSKATKDALELIESKYVIFLSGDDSFRETSYLSNLMNHKNIHQDSIIVPKFDYVSDTNHLINQEIDLPNLRNKFSTFRLLKFLMIQKYVHAIYGLYPREVFTKLFMNPASAFSDNRVSDWWWVLHAVLRSKIFTAEGATYIRNSRIRKIDSTHSYNPMYEKTLSESATSNDLLVNICRFPRRLYYRTTLDFKEVFKESIRYNKLEFRYKFILALVLGFKLLYLLVVNCLKACKKIPILVKKITDLN